MNTGQTERKFCTSAEWDVWEAEQRAAEKPAKESGHEIIVRDQYGILPEEKPEILARVKGIIKNHIELESMPARMLQIAFEIGVEFIELKEKKVYRGKWIEFCREMFPQISPRKIEQYSQLARAKDWLLERYKKRNARFEFSELPPIRQALADIQEKNRETRAEAGKPPIKHRSAKEKRRSGSRDLDGETTVQPDQSEIHAESANVSRPENETEESEPVIAKAIFRIPTTDQVEQAARTIETEIQKAHDDTQADRAAQVSKSNDRWIELVGAVSRILQIDWDANAIADQQLVIDRNPERIRSQIAECEAAVCKLNEFIAALTRKSAFTAG
jgi:hypothetical protein